MWDSAARVVKTLTLLGSTFLDCKGAPLRGHIVRVEVLCVLQVLFFTVPVCYMLFVVVYGGARLAVYHHCDSACQY